MYRLVLQANSKLGSQYYCDVANVQMNKCWAQPLDSTLITFTTNQNHVFLIMFELRGWLKGRIILLSLYK